MRLTLQTNFLNPHMSEVRDRYDNGTNQTEYASSTHLDSDDPILIGIWLGKGMNSVPTFKERGSHSTDLYPSHPHPSSPISVHPHPSLPIFQINLIEHSFWPLLCVCARVCIYTHTYIHIHTFTYYGLCLSLNYNVYMWQCLSLE